MADFKIAINLEAHDLNTAQVIAGIRGNLRGLGGDLEASMGRGGQGGNALASFGAGLTTAGTAVNQLTNSARGVLDPIIQEGVTFERSMSEVLAFGGSKFAPFMDELTEKARTLGRDTEFTGVQAASAMRQLAQAGLDPQQVLGTLPTVLNLAKAGALELGPAAKIVTSAMAQFSVETGDAAMVADTLAKTANSTQTNVREIGQALGFAGTSADLLGLNLSQTSVLLAGLGKTAITSGKAGRWLDSLFLGMSRLTNPDLKKGLREIGVSQQDLADNLSKQDIGAILKQFDAGFAAKGLDGVESAARRLEIITKIFGKQGARAFLALSKTQREGKLDVLADDINNATGAAKEMGDIMADTSKGGILRAQSALSDLKLTIAAELLPALRPLLEDATEAAKRFSEWAKENPDLVRSLGMLLVKTVAFGTVMGPLLTSAGSLVNLFTSVGKVSAVLGGKLNALSPNVSTLTGSKAGMVGMLGAVAAAGMLGVAFGTWLDDTLGISDGIAGLNTEMSIHNQLLGQQLSLQVGLSRIRGAALLGDMTEDERDLVKKAQAKKEKLSAELANETGFLTDNSAIANGLAGRGGRTSSDINAEIQREQNAIDRINEKVMARKKAENDSAMAAAQAAAAQAANPITTKQPDRTDELIQAINGSHFGRAGGVRVVVDRDNRLIGVEGIDDMGVANGTSTEGL